MLSQEAFNIIFNERLIDSKTLHGAVVVIDGKIWMDCSYNRFIFPDRQKAMRAFYDCMKWRARHTAFLHSTENTYRDNPDFRSRYIGENSYLFTQDEYATARDWKRFKRDLINNHGFEIVEI